MAANNSIKLLREELKKAYEKKSISKEIYLQILLSLNKESKNRRKAFEQIAFIMPDRRNPVSDLEQKMVELNVLLVEKFGNVDAVTKIVNDVFTLIPEDSAEKQVFFNVVNHFKYLTELITSNPSFLDIIQERDSYKLE
ncbi:hypothetical protein [Chryseobacterium vrystaatense]|uniref:Uncharacterized protein n=1 Tax=Chryseobacterium vrystaatense TaxID=307480 RepID=A0ABR4UP58_9FLAO|nr:hypothetical protein [Chryseobacterium vrystaatense]KFF26858.1 hypothetical protein IW16_06150 [Chryseobacterium vrystaatense]